MKRLLYCLLAAGFCFSCKPKTLKEEFTPIVQGLWVKKDYIDQILQKKSVAAVPQSYYDITVMNVSTDLGKGDSITVRVGKVTHGLTYVHLYFRPGTKPHTIQMADTDLSYKIDGKDTVITLNYILGGKPDSTKYVKALHYAPKNNVGDGLDTMLNKGLFAGKYNLTENGINKEVTFTVGGKITGLANYKTYYVNNDFVIGGNNIDGLTFDMRLGKPSGLAYKIKADTLNLYTTSVDENEHTIIKDLKYTLVRKK